MEIKRLKMSIPESRELEDSFAKQEQLRADLDFIALMTDVELVVEDENKMRMVDDGKVDTEATA